MRDVKLSQKEGITPIGIIDWRNQNIPFGIKDKDRMGHIYVIGKTGVGKSTLLQNMAISDIVRDNGLAIIDPHGDVAQHLLSNIPKWREKDLIYINPADSTQKVVFNPLGKVSRSQHHLVVSGLISTFKRIWMDSWGPRLEYILTRSLETLLFYPQATLLDINPLLTDLSFRTSVLIHVQSNHLQVFWKDEFSKYSPAYRSEVISPILNKMGVFVSSDPLRKIFGNHTETIDIQNIMNSGKILIVNLSKGTIGEQASSILGSILVNAIQLGALYRAKQPIETRRPFYLYVDEMHSFVSLAFADILAEARKYKLSLFLAHQYIDQLHEKIQSAIFGNIGTLIAFRVGAKDAEILAKEFYPIFNEVNLVRLPKFSMYIKLMIDGVTSVPFSAKTVQSDF
ncbi:MAG TPA: TraM recognition domain-containing protein [Bacteroidia bacterium]|nr:TraM recognition domain-containing protein [Bacteroidia bacterium]